MSCCREGFAKRVMIDLHRKGLSAEAAALEEIEADKKTDPKNETPRRRRPRRSKSRS